MGVGLRLEGMDAGERIVLTLLRNSITRDSALDRMLLQ